jgi:choline dehydrogenase-like flavoprotein
MVYVIGSGPAGVSCAMALVKKGVVVTMLDSGRELGEGEKQLLNRIQSKKSIKSDSELFESIKKIGVNKRGDIPIKLVYGSDFSYRGLNEDSKRKRSFNSRGYSLAKGGYSNVWGAAILPYLDRDILDWPIRVSDLEKHYKEVLSFMQLSTKNLSLNYDYPLYMNYTNIDPSPQAIKIMTRMINNKLSLYKQGFSFNYSRLAFNLNAYGNVNGCKYCGNCLYGCPYELIYNSANTLNELIKYPNFIYKNNYFVNKIIEKNKKIKIIALSLKDNTQVIFKGTKVYLAAGTNSTTRIVLESMAKYDTPLIMKDSQYFVMPYFSFDNISRVNKHQIYTLSQIFLEIYNRNISKNTIHLQLYTYNDMYLKIIKQNVKLLYPLIKYPMKKIAEKMVVIQGYLHSNDSQTANFSITKNFSTKIAKINLDINQNLNMKNTIHLVKEKISKNRKLFKLLPIINQLKIGDFGQGFHTGGTFPMRKSPGLFETDIYGRPHGFRKLHIVDSTVFPSIPATTITMSVMANAHRIGSNYSQTLDN